MREIKLTVQGDTVHASRHRAGVQYEYNATALVITFDESWDAFNKKITFWNALGQNPVVRWLTHDLQVGDDGRTYQTTIPGEPLEVAGECTLVIDGILGDDVRTRSMTVHLTVEEAPKADNAGNPTVPMPDQYEQLLVKVEYLVQQAERYALNPPKIGEDGNWYQWDGAEYKSTGLPSRGERGPRGVGVSGMTYNTDTWCWEVRYTDGRVLEFPGPSQ